MSTIAAIATPQGIGGIGVIRISGVEAFEIADKIFEPFIGEKGNCLKKLQGYCAKYGKIICKGEAIDDAIALVFRAPHSYTGEDVVEISCHGGNYITKKVLRAILDSGAVLAGSGEFTKRAFLNGKMDLSQAEAVMDLISARSERANKIAFSMREGSSSKKINNIKDEITDIMAALSVWTDYPEDDIPQIDNEMLKIKICKIIKNLESMILNYDNFKSLKNGVKVVIVGRPNVGKSTLMNYLSGEKRSIVTNIPGTTRDSIEQTVMIGDIPINLVDTAGMRDTEDLVEKIGVEIAEKQMDEAEIILVVLDGSAPLLEYDEKILKNSNVKNRIIVINKCDENQMVTPENLSTYKSKTVEISALTGKGISKLKDEIEHLIGISDLEPSDVVISSERQLVEIKDAVNLLKTVKKELDHGLTLDAITVLLQDVLGIFMEFTGENVSETIINKVFSKFCVGK